MTRAVHLPYTVQQDEDGVGVLTPSCILASAPTAKVAVVRLRSRTCARPSLG